MPKFSVLYLKYYSLKALRSFRKLLFRPLISVFSVSSEFEFDVIFLNLITYYDLLYRYQVLCNFVLTLISENIKYAL